MELSDARTVGTTLANDCWSFQASTGLAHQQGRVTWGRTNYGLTDQTESPASRAGLSVSVDRLPDVSAKAHHCAMVADPVVDT